MVHAKLERLVDVFSGSDTLDKSSIIRPQILTKVIMGHLLEHHDSLRNRSQTSSIWQPRERGGHKSTHLVDEGHQQPVGHEARHVLRICHL